MCKDQKYPLLKHLNEISKGQQMQLTSPEHLLHERQIKTNNKPG